MADTGSAGFWSYTHRDDELVEGRILRLAKKIGNAFELITGKELEVFVDSTEISWGDSWRERIDKALLNGTFLIPIVTPKFFLSQECRKEVLTFSGHAASLGLDDLLLPIYYVDVPALNEDPSADEVMAIIAKRQWVDWRHLRLEDEGSQRYRSAINEMALRLKGIVESVSPSPILTALESGSAEESSEDEPGFLDVMARAEEVMPRWSETLNEISEVTTDIGSHAQWASDAMAESDRRGRGFAGRLAVVRQMKQRLETPVIRYASLSSKYASELVAIDPAFIAVIRQVADGGLAESDLSAAREFFGVIKGLVESSRQVYPMLEEFSDSVKVPAQQSSDLRPLMKKLGSSIQQVIDGRTIIEEWGRLIDETGLIDDADGQ
ncbi:toll/interleukin-1 receptor domain-containing protein [Kitasatospora sp. NPDC088783]|uniref:toll/interleukin-1 receptor domain-containing protein n=1 Tax=Kitasatospora sp. NPDC088783 TaxID=3364077 RepID=UPI00380E5450